MTISSREEAHELLVSRLNKNATDTRWFSVLKERTIEKPFGRVFLYEVIVSCGGSVSSGPARKIRLAIINKFSSQVIGNSSDQPVESIVQTYEKLLAERKSIAENWCLILNPKDTKSTALKTLAEKAAQAGFYEIS